MSTSTIFQKGAGLLYPSILTTKKLSHLACSSFCPSLSVGFRCNPLSIQTCPPNSSLTDQSPLITEYICLKTTTKASQLLSKQKTEAQFSILLISFTESLYLSEGPSPKTLSPGLYPALDYHMAHYDVSSLTSSASHHPPFKSAAWLREGGTLERHRRTALQRRGGEAH